MSHGGNYSSNDWNDSRQQQQHEQNDYSQYAASMPASYNRNIDNGNEFSNDGFDEAPVAAGPPYGRPPASDFNAESDYHPRLPQRNGRIGLSDSPIQRTMSTSVPRQPSLSDRYFDGSVQFNANSMWPDQAQGSSEGHRFADTTAASDSAVGVGVGIDANLIPYPSLSPTRTSVASYPSASPECCLKKRKQHPSCRRPWQSNRPCQPLASVDATSNTPVSRANQIWWWPKRSKMRATRLETRTSKF